MLLCVSETRLMCRRFEVRNQFSMSERFSFHRAAPLDASGYGVLTVDEIVPGAPVILLSQPNFDATVEALSSLELPERSLVLTPELITSTGDLGSSLSQDRIEQEINMFCQLSADNPGCTFLLGTAYWLEESVMPVNAVLVIRGGAVSQIIAKTHPVPGEEEYFQQNLLPKANRLVDHPQVCILVCRDLYMEGLPPEIRNAPSLITPETTTLLVSSCWGDGSRVTYDMLQNMRSVRDGINTVEGMINTSYKLALDMAIDGVFEQHAQIGRIVVCDRTPELVSSPLPSDTILSTRSFSGVYTRPVA